MNRLLGEIDLFPWLLVTVQTRVGRRVIRFLLDTGFGGEIAIPRTYSSLFGSSDLFVTALFADGVEKKTMDVECQVDWVDGWRPAEANYIDGPNPLLGMGLMSDCTFTFETTGGKGEFVIESNE
jgi:predicted aspartyl protease